MLLSNTKIREALKDGRLSIIPNEHCAFDTTAVNLTLGPVIQVPKKKYPTAVTLGEGNLVQFLNDSSDKHEITPVQPFKLEPQQFLLASTFEVVSLSRESLWHLAEMHGCMYNCMYALRNELNGIGQEKRKNGLE